MSGPSEGFGGGRGGRSVGASGEGGGSVPAGSTVAAW
jgi:hypothetical protein